MLYHLLSIFDILAASSMVLGHYKLMHLPLLYASIYLISKIAFYRDLFTFIDVAAGIYILFVFFGYASGLTWFFVAYFIYKTCVWLFFALTA